MTPYNYISKIFYNEFNYYFMEYSLSNKFVNIIFKINQKFTKVFTITLKSCKVIVYKLLKFEEGNKNCRMY